MRRTALVLTCLACAGRGRRIHEISKQVKNGSHGIYEDLSSSDEVSAYQSSDKSKQLNITAGWSQTLGSLMLAFSPTFGMGQMPERANSRVRRAAASHSMRQGDFDQMDKDVHAILARLAAKSELRTIRETVTKLESDMQAASEREDYTEAARLRDEVHELRSKDPVMLYASVRKRLEAAVEDERYIEAATFQDQLRILKHHLPQYQLSGMWKGSYRDDGDHLVRISYDGDTVYATKVTGDNHVPAGEVTFRADLTHFGDPEEMTEDEEQDGIMVNFQVEVVTLQTEENQSPQKREVPHFEGQGRVAAKGFHQAKYVPGKLYLLDEDVLGFLWVPLGAFVVFNRVKEDSPGASSASGDALRDDFDRL